MKYALIAAAITFALAAPASAQMASDTKMGTAMKTDKPMAGGSMAMSADAGMKDKKMAMKKPKKGMMADKPMAEDGMKSDAMKSDAMKH